MTSPTLPPFTPPPPAPSAADQLIDAGNRVELYGRQMAAAVRDLLEVRNRWVLAQGAGGRHHLENASEMATPERLAAELVAFLEPQLPREFLRQGVAARELLGGRVPDFSAHIAARVGMGWGA